MTAKMWRPAFEWPRSYSRMWVFFPPIEFIPPLLLLPAKNGSSIHSFYLKLEHYCIMVQKGGFVEFPPRPLLFGRGDGCWWYNTSKNFYVESVMLKGEIKWTFFQFYKQYLTGCLLKLVCLKKVCSFSRDNSCLRVISVFNFIIR